MPEITEIRAAAKRLAEAHRESLTRSTALQSMLNRAITPIYEAHLEGLDAAAAEEAEAQAELQRLVDAAPQLFMRPRSFTVDGVKCGYRKSPDGLDWDDEASVIARIRALPGLADLAPVLISTKEVLNRAALEEIDGHDRRRVGIRLIPGIDEAFISFTDSDVEKMVKGLMADAAKRQGEDEAPIKKKGKATVKAVA